MIKLLPEEHKPMAEYIYSICSVILDQSKGYLIEGRLAGLVEESGCTTFSGLLQRARSDRSRTLQRRIIDAITTNETMFFRDTAPFDLLRHKIVPELIDRRARTPRGTDLNLECRLASYRTGDLQYRHPA